MEKKRRTLLRKEKGEDLIIQLEDIDARIRSLETRKHAAVREALAAKDRVMGGQTNKYTAKLHEHKKPRDIMFSLQIPGSDPPKYVDKSETMARLARDYHEALQGEEEAPRGDREHMQSITEVLEAVETELDEDEHRNMERPMTIPELEEALRLSKNGSAPGIDGIPYELWKRLHEIHEMNKKKNNTSFDTLQFLNNAYLDIERNGACDGAHFNEGWMNPIFKKKDQRRIENYRPITLLNTDYKLYTKALALRLSKVVPNLIHESQAGFVPGRSIFNQTELAQLIVEYGDLNETSGAIVALDQEKAYDKINHEYLWATLEAYNLPLRFVNIIKALYQSARTKVAINGVLSTPYEVTRGVRQGDPLSCLLFIIAIEPLSSLLRNSTLGGITIPGCAEPIIATLFADDTTVYLDESDSWADLQEILAKWCKASKARFNIEKTEVIPIGPKRARARLIERRQLSDSLAIPEGIKITKDGDSVRILGARIGNGVSHDDIWKPTLEKIERQLYLWNKRHPDLIARRHILNTSLLATTQYKTQVNGMPKDIQKELTRMIRNFLWDGRSPTISLRTLEQKTQDGGLGVMNLEMRNKAITIMRLKQYLSFDHRPRWAYVADAIMARNITAASGEIDHLAKLNTFLQQWNVARTKLPKRLNELLAIAKETNVSFQALKPSRELLNKLPAWYHLGAKRFLKAAPNSKAGRCLRENHKVCTMSDLYRVVERQRQQTGVPIEARHRNSKRCKCAACKEDRANNCRHPYQCFMTAKAIKKEVENSKWDPEYIQTPSDNLTLTRHRKERNVQAREHNGFITFDPSITTDGSIAHGFRIFTEKGAQCRDPAIRPKGIVLNNERTLAYTDGSCLNNGDNDARAGSGVFFGPGDQRNIAARLPGQNQTNNAGEIIAPLLLLQSVGDFVPVDFVTDSKLVVKGLDENHRDWEANGYIDIANEHEWRALIAKMRSRCAPTRFRWTKGHNGEVGNEGADNEANKGALKNRPDHIDLKVHPKWNLSGASLQNMTQARAYRALMKRKGHETRRQTRTMMEWVREGTQEHTGRAPSNKHILQAVWHKDYTRAERDFLFYMMNAAYKIGPYWANIPNLEERSRCTTCGEIEDMRHILTECRAPGQNEVWRLTKLLWLQKHQRWVQPSIGTILGSSLMKFKKANGKEDRGANRLWRILNGLSAHLIWKLRCERVIQTGRDYSRREIQNRWKTTVENRLRMDRAVTHPRFGAKALSPLTVKRTWSRVIQDEDTLPGGWVRATRVLVGIRWPTLGRNRNRQPP